MSADDREPQPPVLVPYADIATDALQGLVESFVLREGTEYGDRDYTLAQKVSHVMRQLERGEAFVVWDPNTETVDILPDGAAVRRIRDAERAP